MKVSAIHYLVDAGPIVGLLSDNDQWHEWSKQTLSVLDEPLATTETALAESCHLLSHYRPVLQEIMDMLATARLVLGAALSESPHRVGELLAKYPLMDTGDATLVVLSELCRRAKLITIDDDFRRYRRFPNHGIPFVMTDRT